MEPSLSISITTAPEVTIAWPVPVLTTVETDETVKEPVTVFTLLELVLLVLLANEDN